MLELVSKLKTSVVVVERATGELLRMILRKDLSSTSERLEKAPILTPSGRRPQATRKSTRSRVKKRKRKRLFTYKGPTDRKSWTSTLPSLTRILGVEVEEVVDVAAAVDVVEKEGNIVSVARDQMVNVERDKKAIVHQDRREMLLPVVEEIVGAVVVEATGEAEEEGATNKSLALLRKLSLPWDRSIKIVKAKCDPDMYENISGILYSLLTFRAFL